MTTVDINEIKQVLLPIADEVRQKLAQPLNKIAIAHYSAAQTIVSTLLIFLSNAEKKGEVNMKDLVKELKVTITTMGDIPSTTRGGVWPEKVQEQVKKLEELTSEWQKRKGAPEEKPALKLDGQGISVDHFANVLYRLQQKGQIDKSVTVLRRKEDGWLVKK